MVIDVVMPKMGESITEGTILEWYKKVGEHIAADETLLEIGTDKVDSEIPAPNGGIVIEILAQPNDVIDVGEVIARIETIKSENDKEQIIEKRFSACPYPLSTTAEGIQLEMQTSRLFGCRQRRARPTKGRGECW